MTRYVGRVTGLTSVEALWFDNATSDEEMIRDMNIAACSDPRVIFVKLFRAQKLDVGFSVLQLRANIYLYVGIGNKEKKCFMQHFFYANSHAEAFQAVHDWAWEDSALYACTEVVQ